MKTKILLVLFGLISLGALGGPFGPGQGGGTRPFGPASAGSGITSLGGLSDSTQTFATGTSGSDFAVSSSSGVHTFNIPDAGSSARGLVTTGAQTIAGAKTFSSAPNFSSLTASRVPYLDGSKNLATSSVTNTELGYLSGVSSAIQTQINTKAPIASPSFTGAVTGGADGDTSTHLFYGTNFGLTGSTSTAEATFYRSGHDTGNLRLLGGTSGNSAMIRLYGSTHASAPYEGRFYSNNTLVGTFLNTGWILPVDLALSAETANRAAYFDANKKLKALSSVSDTELGYLDGVSSAIQTQIDALKVGTLSGHIETPSAKTYVLEQYAEFAYTLNRVTIDISAGTATAKLTIDGVDVTGCTSISVSTTETTTNCTAANSVSVGNTVALVITSPSSAADMWFTVKYTR